MKQALRYFSLGLLLSALISFSVYYFSNPSTKMANQSTDEMISTIENDGYHVLTEDEYIDFRVKDDDNAKKEDAKQSSDTKKKEQAKKDNDSKQDDTKDKKEKTETKKKDDKDDSKKEKSSKKIKVTVKEGMVSQDVAKLLKDKGVVKDENKFVKYMEDNNISQSMQIGTFELSNDMSFDDIGKALQTYPGN